MGHTEEKKQIAIENKEVQTNKSPLDKHHLDEKPQIDNKSNEDKNDLTPNTNAQDGEDGQRQMDNTQRLIAKYWKPRRSVAERLKEGSYLFVEPNRYIFPGAEVYKDSIDSKDCNDFSDDDSDDSSIGDVSDNEDTQNTDNITVSNGDDHPV